MTNFEYHKETIMEYLASYGGFRIDAYRPNEVLPCFRAFNMDSGCPCSCIFCCHNAMDINEPSCPEKKLAWMRKEYGKEAPHD